jgi:carbon-monoxide dehydrogenase large subunit
LSGTAAPVLTDLMEAGAHYVGRPVPRVEDRALLVGSGRFVDDVDRPGQVHVRIVRSHVPHGRIAHIGAAEASGALAVITAADLEGDPRIPVRVRPNPALERALQPVLAREVVRYVGEPVAAVVAEDPYRAEDLAERLLVDIEPLEPVLDAAAAVDSAVVLHAAVPDNVVDRAQVRTAAAVDEVFAGATLVVADTLRVQRHGAVPLETRGLVAEHDAATGRLTVWGPTKVKQFNRRILAALLGLEVERIRFVEPDVGGAFGARGEFYPEDYLVPWLAMRLGRPVKWIEDRQEHLMATNHSREQECRIEIAAAADGRLLGLRARVLVSLGAYSRTHGMVLPKNTLDHLLGPYRWDAFACESLGVLTNKTPAGTYRGPGQFEPTFCRERLLDRVAAELRLDPAELRRRNLIPVESMPYTITYEGTEPPVILDAGDYPLVWERLLEASDYESLRRSVAERRERGEHVGVGVAAFVEAGGLGPYEWARVTPGADGTFTVHVGIAAVGQGIATALSQVAADALGVPLERIAVSHKDTDDVPEGGGSHSSRSVVFGGSAVAGAVADLLERARAAAAERLGVPPGEVELVAGGLARARGSVEPAFSFAELGCEGAFRYEKTERSYSMGAALAVAVLDPGTGRPSVTRCVVVCDVGRAVNPLIVDGQLVGAAAQGIGGALLEELAYGDDGQPQSTSFMDYCLPTAAELPRIEAIALELQQHRRESANPLGVKGAGEGGIVGIGAAVANAVADAIGAAGHELTRLPVSPERVRQLLRVRGNPAPQGVISR